MINLKRNRSVLQRLFISTHPGPSLLGFVLIAVFRHGTQLRNEPRTIHSSWLCSLARTHLEICFHKGRRCSAPFTLWSWFLYHFQYAIQLRTFAESLSSTIYCACMGNVLVFCTEPPLGRMYMARDWNLFGHNSKYEVIKPRHARDFFTHAPKIMTINTK